ncbi:MAG: integrase family protein [Ramlibacter sp.]|nr:integrase family protein [Ramlibacter sp.]
MRGSVFKRCPCPVRRDDRGRKLACSKAHGSWFYKVDVTGQPGHRRQLVKGGFATKREAQDALAEVLAKAARGVVPAITKLTVAAYLDEWLLRVRPTLEVAAWTNYRTCVDRYVRPGIGEVPLAGLTGAQLTAHYAFLITAGGRNGRPLSPTTVRTVHRVLSKAFGDAVRDDLLPVSPVVKAVPPKRRKYEATVWAAEQAMRFLTAVRADPLYAAWLVALSCGLRRGELAGLRWCDVDLDRAFLRVTTQRTTDTDYNVITKGPKGTGRRTIDLGAGTVAALRAHRDAQQVQAANAAGLLFGEAWSEVPQDRSTNAPDAPWTAPEGLGEGFVFLGEDLRPIHPQRLTELFQLAAKAAGVPVIRLHDARHSCATLALESGVHPKVVQQLLGHSSWSTTMDLYAHRVDRLQREATQRIEDLLLPPRGEDSDGQGVAEAG